MASKTQKPEEAESATRPATATEPSGEAVSREAGGQAKPMKAFTWLGPVEGARLTEKGKPLFEGTLVPGKPCELPETHPTVARWLARGYLKEA